VGLWAGLTTGLVAAGLALLAVWTFRVRAASGWASPLQWRAEPERAAPVETTGVTPWQEDCEG
jgi:hypothetical protein